MKINRRNVKSAVSKLKLAGESANQAAGKLKGAVRAAELLVQRLRAVYSQSCYSDPLLAMVLHGRLESAATIHRKLGEIEGCLTTETGKRI